MAPAEREAGTSEGHPWAGQYRSVKVSELLARDILGDIQRRGLEPGHKLLPEAAMLESYQVGRASLREALRILEIYGVIKIKPGPGGGPVVAQVDSEDFGRTASLYFKLMAGTVGDLLEARAALEPFMARIAAERITPERADSMREVLAAETSTVGDPAAGWGRSSEAFHAEMAGMTGNPILDLFGKSLISLLADRTRSIFPSDERESTCRIHKRIADAIIGGEADEAARLTEVHASALNAKMVELFPYLLQEPIEWH